VNDYELHGFLTVPLHLFSDFFAGIATDHRKRNSATSRKW
jgi:hypothetical protein